MATAPFLIPARCLARVVLPRNSNVLRKVSMDNAEIASTLEEVAHHLEETGATPLYVEAHRRAAHTIRWLEQPAERVLAERGEDGLKSLPSIDDRTVDEIEELIETGHLSLLDELRADTEPEEVFDRVRGIDRPLAAIIEEHLGIVSLEELALAAWDGRLERLKEIDSAEAAELRAALEEHLGYRPKPPPAAYPPVAEVLSVDREYMDKANAGQLPTLAPQRHNPERVAWLPVLHTQRGPRRYTALFSNTDLAHRLGKTGDWVVVYYYTLGRVRQDMVVTETEGDLAGLRVVRGRESESGEHYRQERAPAQVPGSTGTG